MDYIFSQNWSSFYFYNRTCNSQIGAKLQTLVSWLPLLNEEESSHSYEILFLIFFFSDAEIIYGYSERKAKKLEERKKKKKKKNNDDDDDLLDDSSFDNEIAHRKKNLKRKVKSSVLFKPPFLKNNFNIYLWHPFVYVCFRGLPSN